MKSKEKWGVCNLFVFHSLNSVSCSYDINKKTRKKKEKKNNSKVRLHE